MPGTKFSDGIDLLLARASNAGDAQAATDLVTLQQVQALLRGLDVKDPVRAATTTAITLSGLQTVDGVSLNAGDSVLVKNQADATTNGIYLVASGAWTRRTDSDASAEVTPGHTTTVLEGTNKGSTVATSNALAWTLNALVAPAIGTTALNFVPVGGSGITYSAANGMTLTGTAFSVKPATDGGIIVDSNGVSVDTAVFSRTKTFNVGDGSATSYPLLHNFGTRNVRVDLFEDASGEGVIPRILSRTTTTVTITFGAAPASNFYKAIVST